MATTELDGDPQAALLPPGSEIDDIVLEALADTTLKSFTAQPSKITPFSGGSTLRWSVNLPTQGVTVQILLNGVRVSPSGTQTVQPAVTTGYTLTARIRGATKHLGRVTVQVDTGACISAAVPESVIRTQIRQAIDALGIKQRSPAQVEVDAQGIHVALRFEISIDNFVNPDLNVDFTVGLRVRNGSVEPFYTRFDVDVDWPSWVTIISAGASKIVEEILDGRIERLKPQILALLKKQLDAFVAQLPGGRRLHTVTLARDEVRVTACPAGTGMPFMVLTRAA